MAGFLAALTVMTALLGCAPSSRKPVPPDPSLPEIDVLLMKENGEEALKMAQENRIELQTLRAALQDLEARVTALAAQVATHPVDSIRLNAAAIDSLGARVSALEARPTRVVAPPPPPPLATFKPRNGSSSTADAPAAASPAEKEAPVVAPKEKPKGKTSGPEAALYDKAFKEYYARAYPKAIQTFQSLLKQFPDGEYADNAHYWIGECEFSLGNYGKAILAFQKVFAYSGTEKADDAQLKLGYCHLRLGDRKRAGDEFRKVVSLYPDSEYLERAKDELARLEP